MLSFPIQVVLAVAATIALNGAGALLASRTPATRAGALLLSGAALAIPFALEGPPLARLLLAHVAGVLSMRVIEILRVPERFGRAERLVRIVFVGESRWLTRAPRSPELGQHAFAAVEIAIGYVVLVGGARLAPPTTPYATLDGWGRWLGILAGVYLLFEGVTRFMCANLRLFGGKHPPLQRAPILSRTVAEFWGRRWNSVIGLWLRENAYEPLARRGAPRLGVAAAFLASAALHTYAIVPAAGLVAAAWVGAFFVAQGLALLLEARLRVRRRPRLAGRAFTILVFVASGPLFAEGFARGMGI